MGKKINSQKPYIVFTFEDDGGVDAEVFNANLPVQQCSRAPLDILEGAFGKDNVNTTHVAGKADTPPKNTVRQQRRQNLGG